MRNKKNVKIIAIALLCTLMIGAAIGIGVSADEATGEKVATIGMKNLEYGDELKLAVQITAKMDGELYLGVWPEGTKDFKNTDPIYFTNKLNTDGEITYALTQGISARDIDKKFEFCAYVVADDGTVYYGDTITYSVTTYLELRLAAIEGLTDEDSNKQRTLYNAVIAYGAAAKEDLFKEQK